MSDALVRDDRGMFQFFHRIPAERALLVACIVLAFACGSVSGLVCAFAYGVEARPPALVHASGSVAPAVTLQGFRDGALRGNAVGVRLFARDVPVDVAPDGSFALVHPAFRVEEVSVPVPPGMRFVASKNGRKYHAVDSASGERIAPQNRVYFPDAAAAERAGFAK